MKEVEIKIRDINKDEIIKKIKKLGAKKIFEGRVIDFRFDTTDRKLSDEGKALRIRKKGNYFYLNLKGKKNIIENIIDRNEIGVRVSNAKVLHKILNELGFIKIFELSKYRIEYELDNIKFDIDEYDGLSPILEIEANSYSDVEKYLKILRIDENKIGRIYIREILHAKKRYESEKRKKLSKRYNLKAESTNKDKKLFYDDLDDEFENK